MVEVSLNYDNDRHVMVLHLSDKLERAYDLKNKEVKKINDKVDRHIRTVGSLKRRALLVAHTRKVKR